MVNGTWRLGLWSRQVIVPAGRSAAREGVPNYWRGYVHHCLHLSVRGFFLWGMLGLVAAHLIGAGVLLARWSQANPYNQARYTDLILPWRWDDLDRLRAAGWARQGQDALDRGEFWRGLNLVRLALTKDPDDQANRERVARLLLAMRLVPQARQTLAEGLARGYPARSMLDLTFRLASEADTPARWLELVDLARARFDALPESERAAGESRWLAEQRVHALLAADRMVEATAWVTEHYGENDAMRRELEVLAQLEKGEIEEALGAVRAWARARPELAEAWRLRVRTAREAKSWAEMDESLSELRRRWPMQIDGWLYAIVQNKLADRAAEATRWFEDLMLRFGAEEALAVPLALVLSEAKMGAELDRLEADLVERGWSPAPVWSARLREAVEQRSWPEVLTWVTRLRALNHGKAGGAASERRFLELMERLARACLEDVPGAQSDLVEDLSRRSGALKMYELVLRSLLAAERVETAARVLTLAEGPYPESQRLAALRRRIEGTLADRGLAEAVKTPARVPESLEELRSEVATLSAKGEIGEALALIGLARRSGGGWATAGSSSLEDLEFPLRVRAGDVLTAQLLARRLLARSAERVADDVLTLARSAWSEGRADMALLLARELVRAMPGHLDGLRQLQAWLPRDETSEG